MQRRIWPTLEICGSSGPLSRKVPCLHIINVYIKRKLPVWEPKNVISSSVQTPYQRLRAQKLPIVMHRRICPTLEICDSSGPQIPKVPCLHQINVYIKRKLRVWGTQKCNFLVGAKSIPTVTGPQTTCSHAPPYMPNIGNLRHFGTSNPQGTVFPTNQCLYQKEATGVGNPKM